MGGLEVEVDCQGRGLQGEGGSLEALERQRRSHAGWGEDLPSPTLAREVAIAGAEKIYIYFLHNRLYLVSLLQSLQKY